MHSSFRSWPSFSEECFSGTSVLDGANTLTDWGIVLRSKLSFPSWVGRTLYVGRKVINSFSNPHVSLPACPSEPDDFDTEHLQCFAKQVRPLWPSKQRSSIQPRRNFASVQESAR